MADAIDKALAVCMYFIQLRNYAEGSNANPPKISPKQAAVLLEALEEREQQQEQLRECVKVAANIFERQEKVAEAFPALEQWRKEILQSRNARPLERVAAWELTALQCEAEGNSDLAQVARDTAKAIVSRSAA